MRKAVAVSLLLVVATATCAGAAKVKTQLAPGADLSQRLTYRWDRPAGPGPEGLDGKLRAAAEKSMAGRGLRKAAEGDAKVDLVLSYNVGAADQLVAGFGVDADYWGNLVIVPGNDSNVSAGIIVFVSDPASNEALWAGWMILRGTSPQALMVMRDRAPGYVEKILSKVGSSRVDLQACKLEYSIVSPK